jgi:hypothetical protein
MLLTVAACILIKAVEKELVIKVLKKPVFA